MGIGIQRELGKGHIYIYLVHIHSQMFYMFASKEKIIKD